MDIEIIGTGHIFERSVEEVKRRIEEEKPEVIALELDRGRFYALKERFYREKKKRNWRFWKGEGGSFPLLSFLLEKIQSKLGELGVSPGSEMMQAIESGRKEGSNIVLIDRDIKITLNHLLTIPLKEKINLIKFARKEEFNSPLSDKLEELLDERLVEKILNQFKKDLPATYQALVDERDKFMAYNLFHLKREKPQAKILAVVGLGHKKGILNYLSKLKRNEKEMKLREILRERKVSFFQFFSFFLIILLIFFILEITFFIRK